MRSIPQRLHRLATGLGLAGALGAAGPPALSLHPVATVTAPTHVTHAGDGRLFILERRGVIRVYSEARGLLAAPFLDLSGRISTQGEGGLLSLAFHPDYAHNGRFFVSYTEPGGGAGPLTLVVARFHASADDPDRADPSSRAELLRLPKPFANHNGGQLAFGPRDGYLYVSVGDGGSGGDPFCWAQDPQVLLGKLLRLDVDRGSEAPPFYTSAPGNPFAASGDPRRDEIWATGLRNPWRFSFDRVTGDLFIADVGQGEREEIDYQRADSDGGENYGWVVMEGSDCFNPDPGHCPALPTCSAPAYTAPIFDYHRDGVQRAVIGGFRYRGPSRPAQGLYFFGDYGSGHLWVLREEAPGVWARERIPDLDLPDFSLRSFGEGAQGELYLAVADQVQRVVLPVCGDVDQNGLVSEGDVGLLRRHLAGLSALSPQAAARCTVIGSERPCDLRDVAVLRRALGQPPLGPPLAQECAAARL
jgi:glucose/arabinose dehydrogenase